MSIQHKLYVAAVKECHAELGKGNFTKEDVIGELADMIAASGPDGLKELAAEIVRCEMVEAQE